MKKSNLTYKAEKFELRFSALASSERSGCIPASEPHKTHPETMATIMRES